MRYQLSDLGNALAALAARMEPKHVASVADVVAKAMENSKTDSSHLLGFGETLAALAARMEPKDAASVSSRAPLWLRQWRIRKPVPPNCYVLVRRWQRWQRGWSQRTPQVSRHAARKFWLRQWRIRKPMASQLLRLGETLAALAARMEPKDAASVSSRGAQVLAKAMEDTKTGASRLSDLGNALAALAARMEPKGHRGRVADGLAKAVENPQETDASRLSSLGWTLGQLSSRIPSARQTRCVALSILMNQVLMTAEGW